MLHYDVYLFLFRVAVEHVYNESGEFSVSVNASNLVSWKQNKTIASVIETIGIVTVTSNSPSVIATGECTFALK